MMFKPTSAQHDEDGEYLPAIEAGDQTLIHSEHQFDTAEEAIAYATCLADSLEANMLETFQWHGFVPADVDIIED